MMMLIKGWLTSKRGACVTTTNYNFYKIYSSFDALSKDDSSYFNETAHFEKCKQLLVYQILLLPRDILSCGQNSYLYLVALC